MPRITLLDSACHSRLPSHKEVEEAIRRMTPTERRALRESAQEISMGSLIPGLEAVASDVLARIA